MFARSDIHSAAEEFVEVVARFADTVWEAHEIAEMADMLTDRAFMVLSDPEAVF